MTVDVNVDLTDRYTQEQIDHLEEQLLVKMKETIEPKLHELIMNMKSENVNFMMLSFEQKYAFYKIVMHIEDCKKQVAEMRSKSSKSAFLKPLSHITLNGGAGTGKTTLMKFVVDYMRITNQISHMVSATPHHNARKVLTKTIKEEAHTIHKVLKIRPDTYESETFFTQVKDDDSVNLLENCRYLLCDEASFYDVDLFNMILKDIPPTCTVIALGDREQLEPVSKKKGADKNETHLSPFFTDSRFKQLNLTVNNRSGKSPVTDYGNKVRRREINSFNPSMTTIDKETKTGFVVCKSNEQFLKLYKAFVKTPEDLKKTRIVAYTNRDVDDMNDFARKIVYKTDDEFVKGEYIVLQKPVIENTKFNGRTMQEIVYNNGAILKIHDFKKKEYSQRFAEVKRPLEIDIYTLTVEEMDLDLNPENENKTIRNILVVARESQEEFSKFLDDMVKGLLEIKNNEEYRRKNIKPDWKQLNELRNMFSTYKHYPACTIHKSQGMTVENIFYIDGGLKYNDYIGEDTKRRLRYVAISRASKNVILLP